MATQSALPDSHINICDQSTRKLCPFRNPLSLALYRVLQSLRIRLLRMYKVAIKHRFRDIKTLKNQYWINGLRRLSEFNWNSARSKFHQTIGIIVLL
jgi:hypothetical protein